MDDAAQLLSMLSHAYGAQSVASSTPLPVTNSASLIRVSAPQRSAFEQLLTAARDVGHELVSVLAGKMALEGVLDQLLCGLIVVTADLKVLSTNRPARELLDSGNGMTIVERRLVCMDGRSHQKLEQRIQRLHVQAQDDVRSGAIRVARGNDLPDLQVRIVSFDGLHMLPSALEIPTYCLWLFDPKANRTIDCDLLRELHGLTVTEATVTAALFRGLSIDAVATELGVSPNTIKTHLKHTFQKCEVRSQGELLQMLALGPR